LAYRINVNGGIVPIKLNPASVYSSFKRQDFIEYLLKVRKVRVIKLNDGSRMVVREDSFSITTRELFNEKATKLLHEKSEQLSAIIKGPVVIVFPEDWKT